jgi:hypothetical protein
MTQPKAIRVCGHLNPRSLFNLLVSGGMRRGTVEGAFKKSRILKCPAWDLKRPCAALRLGAEEIAGQLTLVGSKRRIPSVCWRRSKMKTWGYPIVEEVDHENVS